MDFLLEQVPFYLKNEKSTYVICFHTAIAVMYLAGLHGYYNVARNASSATATPEELYAGFWKYFTYWNLILHSVFFALSVIIDTIPMECKVHDIIIRIRDTFFAGIIFPYGLFVFLTFWGIYHSNRDKIHPKEKEQTFPTWLNHISHTVKFPVVLLEAFIVHHRYPSILEGYALTAVLGGTYLLWVLYLGIAKDIWVYIFLKDVSWSGKGKFFIAAFFLLFILYLIGEKANQFFWGDVSLPSMD